MGNTFKRLMASAMGSYINFLALVAPKKAARKAFALFSMPRRGKIAEHHTAFLNPARKEKIKLQNLEVQVYFWPGEKETVLLVHGWESHTHRYKILIERLQQQGYAVVAFDAPAHGYSQGLNLHVPIYDEALQQIKEKYRPSTVIGHSIGGMTAIYNQYRSPKKYVKRMVILGAPDKLEDILDDYRKVLQLNGRSMQVLDTYFLRRFGIKKADFSSSTFAETIKIPGLIMHDLQDTITKAQGSKEIHKRWKNSLLILTKGLNHSLYSTAVDDIILKFLEDQKLTSATIAMQGK